MEKKKINVLAMEYPGYGIYKRQKCSEEKLVDDSQNLLKFLINNLEF